MSDNENIPQSVNSEPESAQNTQQPDPGSALALKQTVHDTLRSKRAWAVLALLLFLLAIGTLVPVSRLPFVRNLVYAMGYTPEETMRISLFKAIFSWNEHNKIMRGEISDPNAIDVFGAAEAAARAAEQARGGARPQDGLFNYNAVNARHRLQGQGVEQVVGSTGYKADGDRDEAHKSAIELSGSDVISNTDANGSKVGDVFFGQEVGGVERDKNDGFNSTNSLKRLSLPIVAGGSASGGKDWFLERVDKAFRQDASLDGLENEMQARGLAGGLGNLKVGNTKEERDLYWAWLTGRAARRTPQVILKKTLASAGFDGADIPKSVFLASGYSGVGINPDDVVADITTAEDYLKQDEACARAMNEEFNDSYDKAVEDMRTTIRGLGGSFPVNCAASGNGSAFNNALASVQSQCNAMRTKFSKVASRCAYMKVNVGNDLCYNRFGNLANDFKSYCDEKYEEVRRTCASAADPVTCFNRERTAVDVLTVNDEKDNLEGTIGAQLKGHDLQTEINAGYFNDSDPEGGLKTAYFPSADWEGTLKNQFEGRKDL